MTDIKTVFENFQGQWFFDRVMDCFLTEETTIASGISRFSKDKEKSVLQYQEDGNAVFNQEYKSEFSRKYCYQLKDDLLNIYHVGDQLDGQFYQSYLLDATEKKLNCLETHYCGDDKYAGHYTLIDDNNFTLMTRIKGPRKDCIIRTNFKRVA